MILERGWVWAIKSALRYDIFARVAPQENLNVHSCENNTNVLRGNVTKQDVPIQKAIQTSKIRKHIDNEEIIRNQSHQISSKQTNKTLPRKCNFSREGENDLPGQVIIS